MSRGINKRQSWVRGVPLHPFLFAIYPILALLGINISEVDLSSGIRPLLLSFLMSGIVLVISYPLFRDWKRSALLATLFLILFYSYGHLYILLKSVNINGFYLFRHRTLIPIWLALAVLATWWASRKSLQVGTVTQTFNAVGLALLVLPLTQILSFGLQSRAWQADAEKSHTPLTLQPGSEPPDIYYIILDGYGRADALKDEYGYDNSAFIGSLQDLGFVIAECSQSNYAQTQISLAASLNFNYLGALSDRFTPGSEDRTGLDRLIHQSAARQSLERAGYRTVAFATGFLATELTDADYFLGPGYSWGELNEFESLLMETTLARLIQDGNRFGMQTSGSERFRERTLFTLDQMDDLSYIDGPKFVFVHIIAPHPPYVFGPTGGPVEPAAVGTTKTEEGASHYRDQAIYISDRIREIVPRIIENSETPPVIVIQGDHGPTVASSPRSRMSILNAYYLPGANTSIPPTITPVNTFRLILNTYFGQNLEYLDDVSWYSDYTDPFNFKVVQNTCAPSD
ncbi:MAG TPA: hypothetical protein VFY25_02225 [Anaerolineales bacterium]|nr:hypothetical protein [Anaerolineales bacterium]